MRVRRPPPFLPVGAPRGGPLVERVVQHAADLRPVLPELLRELRAISADAAFDAPFAALAAIIDRELESYLNAPADARSAICSLARYAGAERGAWWVRAFVNDRDVEVRRLALRKALGLTNGQLAYLLVFRVFHRFETAQQ